MPLSTTGTNGGHHDDDGDIGSNHGALEFAALAASHLVRWRWSAGFILVVHLSLAGGSQPPGNERVQAHVGATA